MAAIVNNTLGPLQYTKAAAHQYMIDMDAMLVASGLTKLTFPTMYDVAGSDTQIPSMPASQHATVNISNAITYAFNDQYQSSFPIYLNIYIYQQLDTPAVLDIALQCQ